MAEIALRLPALREWDRFGRGLVLHILDRMPEAATELGAATAATLT